MGHRLHENVRHRNLVMENIMSTNWWLWTVSVALMACFLAHAGRGICGETTFTRVDLATQEDHSWGDVQVGDLNGDGNPDIQAGKQWYEGPDWVRHSFGPNPGNIYGTGQCLLYDVDGDGDLDILGYLAEPYRYCWFENPGPPSTGPWALHIIALVRKEGIRKGWPEGKCIVDLDGDGKDELITLEKDCTGVQRAEIPSKPELSANWKFTQISSTSGHGLAIGDLNEDGRLDIVADYTWLEQRAGGGWAHHDVPQRPGGHRATETTSPLIADLDGDGDKDLFLPRAHNYGAYWLESSGGSSPNFKLHEVLHDQLPSQFYGAAYGDIDGDGDMDVFGGQCHYSHRDPGESDPPDVFWIESVPSGVSGRVTWVKHQLSTQLKMGRYPSIADLDGDGDMDLVMRPIGFGGYRELEPKAQYDVTIFFQKRPGALKLGSAEEPCSQLKNLRYWAKNKGSMALLRGLSAESKLAIPRNSAQRISE